MVQGSDDLQLRAEVLAALAEPALYPVRSQEATPDSVVGPMPGHVERIDTHAAHVFLAGDEALKIKRAVRLSYLDFSTLERRRAALVREMELNSRVAPELYLGVVAIGRAADGRIHIADHIPVGAAVIEWGLLMRRFDQADLLGNRLALRDVSDRDLVRLADTIATMHCDAEVVAGVAAIDHFEHVVAQVAAALDRGDVSGEAGPSLAATLRDGFAGMEPLMRRRAAQGFVRRCHGDLHLANIVMLGRGPVPFDALEFDETLATVDVLYDLAFLLMDLEHAGARHAANVVFNRYVSRSMRSLEALGGLRALAPFEALRAGVRAMVALDRARQLDPDAAGPILDEAEGYRQLAADLLHPGAPAFVAIGGLSGTGKTSLAAMLAAELDGAPGAVHVRSDVERKLLSGVAEADRLPSESYTAEASARVYQVVLDRCEAVAAAGRSVIVDAVFARGEERDAVEAVASRLGRPFHGLWLEAPLAIARARVGRRSGDASDATPAVVDAQSSYDLGAIRWSRIAAGGAASETLAAARRVLARCPG